MPTDTPYEQGRQDGLAGVAADDCPYEVWNIHDTRALTWLYGWCEGDLERTDDSPPEEDDEWTIPTPCLAATRIAPATAR